MHRWYQNVLSGFKQAKKNKATLAKDDLEVYQDGQYTDIALPSNQSSSRTLGQSNGNSYLRKND